MQANRKVESLAKDAEKHETYAMAALEKGNESLALEIAQKIAEIQSELDLHKKTQASFAAHTVRLKTMIKQATKGLTDMQRQLVMVKTTESVQKATKAITNNYASSSSKLLTAKESLDRIKQRQDDLEDRMIAGESLAGDFDGNDLENKMREAGIVKGDSGANDILAKLKAKQNS